MTQTPSKPIVIFSLILLATLTLANGSKKEIPSFSNFCRFIDRAQLAQLPRNQQPVTLRDIIENVGQIGSGGFGRVYPAVWNGKEVAIKVSENIASNRNEVDFLLELQGISNIPKLYDCERDVHYIYQVQSRLYSSLASDTIIQAIQDWSLGERAYFLQSIAKTLQKIHKRNIYHNDIKLPNLMIDSNGSNRVYFIDFGISRWKGNTSSSAGTLIFNSYEKLTGGRYKLDEMEDVWQLGLTFADIELMMDSAHLGSSYQYCLERFGRSAGQAIDRLLLRKCFDSMVQSIFNAFDNNKVRISKGGNFDAFVKYLTTIMNTIQVDKRKRSTLQEFINGLDEVLKACDYEHTDLEEEDQETTIPSMPIQFFAQAKSLTSPSFGTHRSISQNPQSNQAAAQAFPFKNILSELSDGVVNWLADKFKYFEVRGNQNSDHSISNLADILKEDDSEENVGMDVADKLIPLSAKTIAETTKIRPFKIQV
jgi:serine/threonine protein kinase